MSAGNKNVRCCYEKACGACNGGIDYEDTLKNKEAQVKKLLAKFKEAEPIIGMENPYFYRHKVHAVFGRDKGGRIISGTYREGTHRIVPVRVCLIEDRQARDVINTVEQLIGEFGLTVYNEDTGRGLIRHCVVRKSYAKKEFMVVIVTTDMPFVSRRNFVKELVRRCPYITTVVQSINHKATTFVMGDKHNTIYGNGFITDVLCGCRFRLSPQSFYQVNPVQTEVMYRLAIEGAELEKFPKGSLAIDTYCGIGTIGIIGAVNAPHLNFIGVELNRAAVADARRNAAMNGLDNITFVNKDASRFMEELAGTKRHVGVVFMDPPRSGSTKAFLNAIKVLSPLRVVYISCNPETLARDAACLVGFGYEMVKATPVDNFCFTQHTEVVAIFRQRKK